MPCGLFDIRGICIHKTYLKERSQIMKKTRLVTLVFAVLLSLNLSAQDNTLKAGFENPPQLSRPRVWWHWMNGNISKDGIYKDLMWMHRVGIGGVHIFDAGMRTPQIVPKRIIFMTPEWKDCFKYAVHLADSLGMEATVTAAPGWSNTGGPWVEPQDAMKKLVWREMVINGGKAVKVSLPAPYTTIGAFQNIPEETSYRGKSLYEDISVLAVRMNSEELSMQEMGAKITSSDGEFTLEQLTDGDLAKADTLPADTAKGFKWIQIEFNKPYTIKALCIDDGKKFRLWDVNPPKPVKFLMASNDGQVYNKVCDIPVGSAYLQTLNIPATTAKYFRVCFENQSKPIPITELQLFNVAKVNRAADKAAFGTPSDIALHPTLSDDKAPSLADVIDLTPLANGKEQFTWKAPKGKWRIYRFGYSLTGKTNHPASPEATGLEVDKLDADASKRYLEHLISLYQDASGNMIGERGIRHMMFDSYEAGIYTWTPKIMQEFRQRRGYDLLPWMPALTGQIVESAQKTDQFLFDWRKTLSELIAQNLYGQAEKILKEHHMMSYMESHESARPFLADGMEVKKNADIPMGAMWASTGVMNFEDQKEFGKQGDIHESASVAHLYGQNLVAAESLTANGRDGNGLAYSLYPAILKRVADLEFASGLNYFVVHESAHQPVDDKIPGEGLQIYGQWFHRHETWAEQAKPWMDYLARTCYMLRQGQYVADVAYYYGEDGNVTSLFTNEPPKIPYTYNFDYVNTDALVNLLSFDGSNITSPSGMKYKLLAMDKNATRITVPTLKKLDEMVKNGAYLCAERPTVNPSLSDSQEEWNSLVNDIWGTGRKNVFANQSIEEVLKTIHVKPDFTCSDMDSLRFMHRFTQDAEIYWVNNRSFRTRDIDGIFRTTGLKPTIWHPETGKVEAANYLESDETTRVSLRLVSGEAVFVVFQGQEDIHGTQDLPQTEVSELKTITTPWVLEFQKNLGAPEQITIDSLKSYTDFEDPGIKYFSGTTAYKNHFDLSKKEMKQGRILLDLGNVCYLAEVYVNGKNLGILWHAPYQLDITDALQKGNNDIEVRVTSLWRNRIIGDQQPGCKQTYTYTSYKFYRANSKLIPAGLLGPVKLKIETQK
jgi:hypothetical protein